RNLKRFIEAFIVEHQYEILFTGENNSMTREHFHVVAIHHQPRVGSGGCFCNGNLIEGDVAAAGFIRVVKSNKAGKLTGCVGKVSEISVEVVFVEHTKGRPVRASDRLLNRKFSTRSDRRRKSC